MGWGRLRHEGGMAAVLICGADSTPAATPIGNFSCYRGCCGRRRCWMQRRASASAATASPSCRCHAELACSWEEVLPCIAPVRAAKAFQSCDCHLQACMQDVYVFDICLHRAVTRRALQTKLRPDVLRRLIQLLSIALCSLQEKLPAAKEGGEPLPEGLMWLLLTGEVLHTEAPDALLFFMAKGPLADVAAAHVAAAHRQDAHLHVTDALRVPQQRASSLMLPGLMWLPASKGAATCAPLSFETCASSR